MKSLLIALLAALAVSAVELSDTIKKIQSSNGIEPREFFYTLDVEVPKTIGDSGTSEKLETLLRAAVAAPETTPAARTVLSQYLLRIAKKPEAEPLGETFAGTNSARPEPPEVYETRLKNGTSAEKIAALSVLNNYYRRKNSAEQMITDADPLVANTALQLLSDDALLRVLPDLTGFRLQTALQVVSERKLKRAAPIVRRLLKKECPETAQTLAAIGSSEDVERLAELGEENAVALLPGGDVEARMMELVRKSENAEVRRTILSAAQIRNASNLQQQLALGLVDTSAEVRRVAFRLTGRYGSQELFQTVAGAIGGPDSEAAESAARLMIRRLDAPSAFLPLVTAKLPAGYRVLSAFSSKEALDAVLKGLPEEAAVRALCGWQTPDAIERLKAISADEKYSRTLRTLSEQAAERLEQTDERKFAEAYLDCGPDALKTSGRNGVKISCARGQGYAFEKTPAGTVVFSGGDVVFEFDGLQAGTNYKVGFSWWDYDSGGRIMSVQTPRGKLLDGVRLPARKGENRSAEDRTVVVGADEIKDGKVSLRFVREGGPNALVGEIWILPTKQNASAVAEKPMRMPSVMANRYALKKVLIITGMEHHNCWKATTDILVKTLADEKQMEISVCEDPRILSRADVLAAYDAFVLNYNNSDKKPPPENSLANLKRLVEGGRGLVIVHFASGAFYDWNSKTVDVDFRKIAARVWNPKLRGHDPHGTFRVRIADTAHPIVKGVSDFDALDELYTCLEGEIPIHVVADAVSKVDGKVYPLVFTANPGKGRTFHCALGHDPRAFNESTCRLYLNGTSWAAGLER